MIEAAKEIVTMTATEPTGSDSATGADSTTAPAGATWTLDPAGSRVVFRSTALWGLIKVKGTFSGLSGTAQVGPDGTATADLVIDTATVDTGKAKRDTHLRSADFFDVEKNPTIVFRVTGVTDGGGTKARLPGTLSVFGQTHPLDVEAAIEREGDSALTLTSTTVVDRSAWGNGWKKMGMTKFDTPVEVTVRFVRAD
jgi:polyisoprenoid-binding protein YceI